MARILIIDDDEDIRSLVKTILNSENHEVLLAQDAFEAADIIDAARFDLVICDINMPKKNGFSLLQELRRARRNQFLTVAFLTARSDKRDIERAIKIGADGYMIKPIVKDDFISKVNSLLNKNPSRVDLTFNVSQEFEDPLSKITIERPGKLIQISDLGILIQLDHPLAVGEPILYDSKIFSLIGIKPPIAMTVNSMKKVSNEIWHGSLIYRNLPYETRQEITSWLKRQKEGLAKKVV